jgi:hypothetical protein
MGTDPRRIAVLSVLAVLLLTGCTRTLVFVERTGFNLGIFVKPNESTPLEVNFGLDRKVASIVPAKGEIGSQGVDGEAVNMYAGFRAQYDSATNPLSGDLHIRTQFASGGAALVIAGEPAVVARVVDVNAIVHDDSFRAPDSKANKAELSKQLGLLSDAQQVRLANAMIPNLASRSPQFQVQLRSLMPASASFGSGQQAAARRFNGFWIQTEEDMTGANFDQWKTAIQKAS